MPSYNIEMLWTCSGCKEPLNRGLARHCHNCGKPKGPEDAERLPNDTSSRAALKGAADLRARTGPDWKCAYCGTLQPKLGRCCMNCGVDQTTGTEPWKHGAQRAPAKAPVSQEPREPAPRVPSPPTTPRWTEEPLRSPSLPRFSIPWKAIVVASGTGALALLCWWLLTPRIVDAEVISIHWERRVVIYRYQLNPEDGWKPPSNAIDVQQQGTRVHHYDRVKVGSHTESYPEQYACGRDCQTIPGSCSTSPIRSCSMCGAPWFGSLDTQGWPKEAEPCTECGHQHYYN